jgi:hypothetical protein
MKQKSKQLHPQWQSDMIDSFIEKRRCEGTLILDFLSSAKEKGLLPRLR